HNGGNWVEYEQQDPSYRRPGKELGLGDFSKIPNGLPGIEDRLMVMWQLGVNSGKISPSRFVELNCTNPAKIFGMYPRKGTIAVGADADIVVWDPKERRTLSASTHHMRCDYNLYEGMKVKGAPVLVYQRGKKLVDGDQWLGNNGGGQFIPRKAGAPVL
ncbi:MAG: amidohydrolase family protein, partial [Anaerolineae bacterium]|nr:amidohydrolase family protein [Anaerolineae bacterium]